MDLGAYLARIGFAGDPRPDLASLQDLCLAHVNTVPFENLDVQLGRHLTIAREAAYAKIVEHRRGGWCYELNGLFGWALQEIGFEITRVGAAVRRDKLGDSQHATHLCLLVRLDQEYLVDVGFGSSLAGPMPFRATEREDPPYTLSLAPADGDYWRFTESAVNGEMSFDFRPVPVDDADLAAQCERQQSHPESPFVRRLTAQRRVGDAHLSLRGRMFSRLDASGETTTELTSPDEFVSILQDSFGLDVPEVAGLWDRTAPTAD